MPLLLPGGIAAVGALLCPMLLTASKRLVRCSCINAVVRAILAPAPASAVAPAVAPAAPVALAHFRECE
jgi:hypothetical protein